MYLSTCLLICLCFTLTQTFIGHLLYVRRWEYADEWPQPCPRQSLLSGREKDGRQPRSSLMDICNDNRRKQELRKQWASRKFLRRGCCPKVIVRTGFLFARIFSAFLAPSHLTFCWIDCILFIPPLSTHFAFIESIYTTLGGYTDIFNLYTWLQAES